MGRGRDKTIQLGDLKNMSPRESSAVMAAAKLGRIKVHGTAVVRDVSGNARYDHPSKAGQYNEDRI